MGDVAHQFRPGVVLREALQSGYSLFDEARDHLSVDPTTNGVRMFYRSAATSPTEADSTWMELRYYRYSHQMWIGFLRVAIPHRGKGIGRRLALVAEDVSNALEAESILVFPLFSARSFWLELGYKQSARTARVMLKSPCPRSPAGRWTKRAARMRRFCTPRWRPPSGTALHLGNASQSFSCDFNDSNLEELLPDRWGAQHPKAAHPTIRRIPCHAYTAPATCGYTTRGRSAQRAMLLSIGSVSG